MEIFLSLIVPVAIGVFLFIDAPKHGKNQWLWGILGLLFTLLPLGIYLIQTGRKVAGWIFVVLSIFSLILIVALFSLAIAFFKSSGGM